MNEFWRLSLCLIHNIINILDICTIVINRFSRVISDVLLGV